MGRNIVIEPNRSNTGSTQQPHIYFSGLTAGTISLVVEDDGSLVYDGTYGGLFSITDTKEGLLNSVNNISGLSILQVWDDNRVILGSFYDPALTVSGSTTFIGPTGSTSSKLHISGGTIQYKDGNQSLNKVLTSDANGIATWQNLPVTSGVLGISNSAGTYTFYSTLGAAMSAATSGQVIEMFTDIIETTNSVTLKNGVKLNGNGHSYTYTYASGNTFTEDISGSIFEFYNLTIKRTAATTTGYIFYGTSSNTYLTFNGCYVEDNITSGGYTSFYFIRGSIRGVRLSCLGAGVTYGISSGTLSNNCRISYCEVNVVGSGVAIYSQGGEVSYCKGTSVSGDGILGSVSSYMTHSIGISTSGSGISNDNGLYMLNCTAISTSGTAAKGKLINTTAISTSGAGCSQNNKFAENSNIRSTSGAAISGDIRAVNTTLYSVSNVVSVGVGGANYIYVYNCHATTDWNSSSSYCFECYYGAEIMNSYCKVANSGATIISVYTTGTPTAKLANNTYVGCSIPYNPAKVTQTITNTQDNQGNIIIN